MIHPMQFKVKQLEKMAKNLVLGPILVHLTQNQAAEFF